MKLTTAFEARRRIVTLLDGYTGLGETGGGSVKVTRGGPTKLIEVDTDMVFFDPAVDDTDGELPALGGQRRDEEYVLPLKVYIFRRGDDEQGTEERCEQVADLVVSALWTDLNLGTADTDEGHPGLFLKQALEIDHWEIRTDPVGEPPGWRSEVLMHIRCNAFLLNN